MMIIGDGAGVPSQTEPDVNRVMARAENEGSGRFSNHGVDKTLC